MDTIAGMLDIQNKLKVAEEFWDFLSGKDTYGRKTNKAVKNRLLNITNKNDKEEFRYICGAIVFEDAKDKQSVFLTNLKNSNSHISQKGFYLHFSWKNILKYQKQIKLEENISLLKRY